MRKLPILLLAAATCLSAEVFKIPFALPGLPSIPGFTGAIEVAVKPDTPATCVRVTVQTVTGPMVREADVTWSGYAWVVFPVPDIIGVPEVGACQ
jgi:hypothetical protein